MAQGGQPSTDVMAKLTAASGRLSDPEKEPRRQIFLAHLQEVESLRQGRNLPAMKMPLAQPAAIACGEYLVVPGQEYLISGTLRGELHGCRRPRPWHDRQGPTRADFCDLDASDAELNSNIRRRAGLMILGGAARARVCRAALLVHFHLF
jgi:hypothetical protein